MTCTEHDIEDLHGFQNLDTDDSWLSHDPSFEWTEEDLAEFEHDRRLAENERLAMAAWWEDEGVRCWTFGPPRNPYLTEEERNDGLPGLRRNGMYLSRE